MRAHAVRGENRAAQGAAALALVLSAAGAAAASEPEAGPDHHPEDKGWELAWADEFGGDALDPDKWAPEQSCWGGGNEERQCYTAREANVQVADGRLRLIARPEVFTGPDRPEELRADPDDPETRERDYTSGKVRTRGLADWKYGRFAARMKLPEGQGVWPAFWMMPAGDVYGRWPLSGEIDILEAINLGAACEDCPGGREHRIHGALHYGALPPENEHQVQASPTPGETPPSDGYHVYAVEWGEGRIQWFVDDQLYFRLDAEDWHTAAPEAEGRDAAPFDQPFYAMLNLAVGGRWPEGENETGFDPAALPAELSVDWVRIHQCAPDPETGRACMQDRPVDTAAD